MNRCEAEIDAIRLRLYEETKGLTVEENNKRLRELGQKLSEQYGFTIVDVARRTPQAARVAETNPA